MSYDYRPVKDALAAGADPAMLCATCPWDRNCINPPTMTAADIDEQMRQAAAKDDAQAKAHPGALPTATLLMAAVYAGKDTALQACPVFALRLRSSDGRKLAEDIRAAMQSWKD